MEAAWKEVSRAKDKVENERCKEAYKEEKRKTKKEVNEQFGK